MPGSALFQEAVNRARAPSHHGRSRPHRIPPGIGLLVVHLDQEPALVVATLDPLQRVAAPDLLAVEPEGDVAFVELVGHGRRFVLILPGLLEVPIRPRVPYENRAAPRTRPPGSCPRSRCTPADGLRWGRRDGSRRDRWKGPSAPTTTSRRPPPRDGGHSGGSGPIEEGPFPSCARQGGVEEVRRAAWPRGAPPAGPRDR